jgi:flagellin
VTESEYDGDYTVETAIDDDTGDVTITLKQGSETVATETVSSEEHAVGGTVTVGDITFDFEANGIQGGESDTITVTPYSPKTDASPASAVVTITNLDDPSASVEASNFDIEYAEGLVDGTYEANLTITDESMVFHIGANSGQNTKLSINNMDAASLGVDGINLETQEGADVAIKTIDDAITKVSSQRAALGAMQNRLEHTINNLGTAAENLTAAESRIRDVDMAKEMMEFTKNNILSQASQAMLAQANLQPQSVLQLLQ